VHDGRILDCNTPALTRLACTREELLGQAPHVLFSLLETSQGEGHPPSAQLDVIPLAGPESSGVLVVVREKDGFVSSGPDPAFGHDIQEQNRKLESLGLMAGGLAHDFNNFLLAILGNADLLDRDLAAGKPGDELLSEIRKAAGRAADLCSQLLAYAGKGKTTFQPVDLSQTVREMLPMLKVAVPRRIAMRLDLAENLPPVSADLGQIHQMIMNLVVNASEAIGSEEGCITLATGMAECHGSQADLCLFGQGVGRGQTVFLEIRDSGCGMEQDIRRQMFDPYFSTKIRGRGLGLTTVMGSVRSHQGSLCVKTHPARGTSLRACFPTTPFVESPVVPLRTTRKESSQQGSILIVDDEEYLRLLCSRMLQRLGYSVILAWDGPQALEIYRTQQDSIDGVILDLEMPVMDGIEVLERLLAFDPAARVIMTSGYHQREIAARYPHRGIAGFIQKPYVMSDLGEVLDQVINPRE
jgi:signal transduction histidine kinase/CheY-like chemotaxis protein